MAKDATQQTVPHKLAQAPTQENPAASNLPPQTTNNIRPQMGQAPNPNQNQSQNQAMNPYQQKKAELLAQLNDVKTPEAIGLWPPAIGWWLIVLCVSAAIVLGIHAIQKRVRGNRYRKQAVKKLTYIRKEEIAKDNQNQALTSALKVLKQCFFTAYPPARRYTAGMHGSSFLALLDATCTSTTFSRFDSYLESSLYARNTVQDYQQLSAFLDMAITWVNKHKHLNNSAFVQIIEQQFGRGITLSPEAQLQNSNLTPTQTSSGQPNQGGAHASV